MATNPDATKPVAAAGEAEAEREGPAVSNGFRSHAPTPPVGPTSPEVLAKESDPLTDGGSMTSEIVQASPPASGPVLAAQEDPLLEDTTEAVPSGDDQAPYALTTVAKETTPEAGSPRASGSATVTPPVPGLPDPAAEGNDNDEVGSEVADYKQMVEQYQAPPGPAVGEICDGFVVSLTSEGAVVDFGSKTEGLVPLVECYDDAGTPLLAAGQQIKVVLEKGGQPGTYARLSFGKARLSRALDKAEAHFRNRTTVTVKVAGEVKGGLRVDLAGLDAFLPASHVDIRPTAGLEKLTGETLDVRVVKFDRRRVNIVVSRRDLLMEQLNRLKAETLAKLSEGAAVEGKVKNITSYGAFVDLGGLDGLLHVTDMSWKRIKSPRDVLAPGQQIRVKVLKYDRAREHVSLSLKHFEPDPWEGVEDRYEEGQRVRGTVVSLSDYGAFITLEEGLEGLVHASEISWSRRAKHPKKLLKVNQTIEAVVLKASQKQRRISLSIKQLRPDPWTLALERYERGSVVEGKVQQLAPYGAFVEVEEGIEGLVHLSDFSWTNHVKDPSEVLKKGQNIQAAVLFVDSENQRLSLGIKQLEPNAWDDFFGLHLVGDVVRGAVKRQAKFGAFVEVMPGVEGLCHNSEMKTSRRGRPPELEIGREYEFKIVQLNRDDRRIGLSRRGLEA